MTTSTATTTTASTTSTTTNKQSTFNYEFGGPIGAFATTVALPIVVLLLAYWTQQGALVFPTNNIVSTLIGSYNDSNNDNSFNAMTYVYCTFGLIAWFTMLVLLWAILPGPIVEGVEITKDHRLLYKINGHLTFWVIVLLVVITRVPLNEYLFRYYVPLATMDIVICSIMSLVLYHSSFYPKNKILAKGGNSGNPIYDFFMGRELNPRTNIGGSGSTSSSNFGFDWKVFCELRPGLIGWMLLNYACLQEQYKVYGTISGSMILINVFQAIYVWDALYQERAILTTMDVTTDGFGFMLVFGDLTWVPFTYTVPAKYLVHYDPQLSNMTLGMIVCIYLLGYTIFRAANGQKDIFRRNPQDERVAKLQYMQTKRGTKLLTSGWWGMARKINYTGDYLMGLTYSLLCGFDSIVPYYYAIYFAILLIHRSIRDDEMCHAKYGDDWLEYKRQVPYRFIPGIV